MLLLFFILFCAIWFAICYLFDKIEIKKNQYDSYEFTTARVFAVVFAFIFLIALVIAQVAVNYEVSRTKQHIVQLENQRKIYMERKVVLFAPFQNMLDSNYGSHEKELYKMITGNKPVTNGQGMNFNINFYPGIKYASTLTDLSNRLQVLTDAIYNQTLEMEKDKFWLRQIKSSPWIIGRWLQSTE